MTHPTLPSTGPVSVPLEHAVGRLCHRFPTLLVDAVVEIVRGERIVAIKNVTVNEDYFQGHFPGSPLMPGVLMIESLAQAASILLAESATLRPGSRPFLWGVDGAKFRRQVVPGDVVRLEVTLGRARARMLRAKGVATVDGGVVDANITSNIEA